MTLFILLIQLLGAHSSLGALTLTEKGESKNFLYEADPNSLLTSVQLVFKTGSLADPKEKSGLASLSFQSLLRGTKQKSRKDFFSSLERLGASVDINTGSNRVILSLDVIDENFEPALDLVAEAVVSASLNDHDIESLKQEEASQIQQELANNRNVLRRAFRHALFVDTALSTPSNGTEQGIKNVSPTDIRSFLSENLKSGSVVVAALSRRPQTQMKSSIEKAFAALPEGVAPKLPPLKFRKIEGRNLVYVERAGSNTTEIAIGHYGIEAGHPDREALEVGQFLLGGDMSSRLFQELRAKRGWTYGAYAGFQLLEQPRRHGGSFQIYTFPQSQHTTETTLEAIKLYENFVSQGPTKTELKFAQQSLGNSYPFKFATSKARLTNRLYEHLDGAPLKSVAEYQKFIRGLSQTKLTMAMKKNFDTKNILIVMVGTPEQRALAEKVPDLASFKVMADPQLGK